MGQFGQVAVLHIPALPLLERSHIRYTEKIREFIASSRKAEARPSLASSWTMLVSDMVEG